MDEPTGRSWVFPAILLAGLAVVQLLAAPGHYLGQEHDDIQYVLTAISMVKGRLSLGILPGDPAVTFNTPGWPALLVPAALFSGDRPGGYQIWCWAWLVLCDVLVWLWLRRRVRPSLALAATAWFALNPLILSRSGVAMSEVPFLAFALLALLNLEAAPGWLTGLILSWSWLIRPAALPLFPAVGLFYVLRKRWKDLAGAALATAVPIVLWKAWVGAHGQQMQELSELSENWAGVHLREVAAYAFANLSQAVSLWGASASPWTPSPDYSGGARVVGVLLAGAFVAGAVRSQRRRGYEPAAAFVVCGALMHAFWPWWYERYLICFVPFLIWGAVECLEWVPKPGLEASLAVLTALTFAAQGRALVPPAPERLRPELSRTYEWIAQNTPPQAVFASALFCRDAYYSGRLFVPFRGNAELKAADSPQRLAGLLARDRVSYVLWEEAQDFASSRQERAPSAQALSGARSRLVEPAFTLVFRDPGGLAAVYRLRQGD